MTQSPVLLHSSPAACCCGNGQAVSCSYSSNFLFASVLNLYQPCWDISILSWVRWFISASPAQLPPYCILPNGRDSSFAEAPSPRSGLALQKKMWSTIKICICSTRLPNETTLRPSGKLIKRSEQGRAETDHQSDFTKTAALNSHLPQTVHIRASCTVLATEQVASPNWMQWRARENLCWYELILSQMLIFRQIMSLSDSQDNEMLQ